MPSSGRALVIGGGISAGAPFVLDQFLYVQSVTNPTAASFAGLMRGTNAIEAPGTQAARANLNTVIGGGTTTINNAATTRYVVIGADHSVGTGSTPVTGVVVLGYGITGVNTTQGIFIGGSFADGGSTGTIKIGVGSGVGGLHNNATAVGMGMTLGGAFNGVQIGQGSSTSGGGSNAIVIGSGAAGQTNVVVVGQGSAGHNSNTSVLGNGIVNGGGGGVNNVFLGNNQVPQGAPLNNGIAIGNGTENHSGVITVGNNNLGAQGFSVTLLWGGANLHTSGTAVPAWTERYKNAAGTNVAAGDIGIEAALATGNAANANMDFRVGVTGSSGTTLATAASVLRLIGGTVGVSVGLGNTDRDTILTIGPGGAGATAPRTVAANLDVPHTAGQVGSSIVRYRRAGSSIWVEGIDATGASGAKRQNSDWFLQTSAGVYAAALSTVDTQLNLTSGYSYAVAGTQVVTARQTGWTAPTGTQSRATFDTATVTTEQLAQRVFALITDLTTHGLIGA